MLYGSECWMVNKKEQSMSNTRNDRIRNEMFERWRGRVGVNRQKIKNRDLRRCRITMAENYLVECVKQGVKTRKLR